MATRDKLLTAAREIYSEGEKLSIAAAAERAGISVATAYRYYSDPDKMRSDAALGAKFGPNPEDFLARFDVLCAGCSDPLERLVIAQRMMFDFVVENEREYRMFISSSHEHMMRASPNRKKIPAGGRRIILLEAALEPLKEDLANGCLRELLYRLMLVCGPEPYFILHDFTSEKIEDIWRVNETAVRAVYQDFIAAQA